MAVPQDFGHAWKAGNHDSYEDFGKANEGSYVLARCATWLGWG